jgi:hypothetical protein
MNVVGDNNGHNDGHDGQDDQKEDEADPSLLAGSTGRYDGLLSISETSRG